MFCTHGNLEFPVRIETPNRDFARMEQQAIDRIEGEIRVCLQYFLQAWGHAGRPLVPG